MTKMKMDVIQHLANGIQQIINYEYPQWPCVWIGGGKWTKRFLHRCKTKFYFFVYDPVTYWFTSKEPYINSGETGP